MMGRVKRAYTNGATTNGELKALVTNRVSIGDTEVVPKAVHEFTLRELATARRVLERFGLGYVGSIAEGIDALGIYAAKYGWNCQADLDEYHDWLATVDDASDRR